jgi:hypothetical protein
VKLRTAALIVAVLAGLLLAMLIFVISEDDNGKPVFVTPTTTAPVRGHTKVTCKVGKDAGCGTPNASCASNRVGLSFIKNGVTYTCKGPKPYRWRR